MKRLICLVAIIALAMLALSCNQESSQYPEVSRSPEPPNASSLLIPFIGDSGLTDPNAQDRAFAAELDPRILTQARDFLLTYRWMEEKYARTCAIFAAREVGDYILLDVNLSSKLKGGHRHLVYCTKTKQILGYFCWYIQM